MDRLTISLPRPDLPDEAGLEPDIGNARRQIYSPNQVDEAIVAASCWAAPSFLPSRSGSESGQYPSRRDRL